MQLHTNSTIPIGVNKGEDLTYEVWVAFALLFAMSGLLGNTFFLIAVAYARKKKSDGFHKLQKTIYLCNLALVDILFCLFFVANWAVGMININGIDIPFAVCKILVVGRRNLSVIDGWSTAAFAINVAFPKIK